MSDPGRFASLHLRGRRVLITAIVFATIFWACAQPAAADAAEPDKLRVVSVERDARQAVSLVVHLGPRTSAVPQSAFSVSPRSTSDPLRVTRLGARGVDLMLVYEAPAQPPPSFAACVRRRPRCS